MKKILTTAFTSWVGLLAAQNVGIGTATPNSSAKLEIVDANRGILMPRVALTATNVAAPVASPANWLIVFNTNVSAPGPFAVTQGLYYWDGTQWVKFQASNTNDWTLLGNAGTVDGTNFIGTTDNIPFNVRVNNTQSGKIDQNNANAFWGYRSGMSNTTGSSNTALGQDALRFNTTGRVNTAVGTIALEKNTTGINNTAVGGSSLSNNTIGEFNTGVGVSTLVGNTTGSLNTAVGNYAMVTNVSGGGNTAVGNEALKFNSTANNNTALGAYSMFFNSTGTENTASGQNSMYNNTTGNYNTALGAGALSANTSASHNTAVGRQALRDNSTGYDNTGLGVYALFRNTTGHNNVAVGDEAMSQSTTGYQNVALGELALRNNSSGFNNVALGRSAGLDNGAGSNNTFLGVQTNAASTNLTNATAVGANVVVTQSNTVILGNNANVGVGTTAPAYKVDIAAGGLRNAGVVHTGVSAAGVRQHLALAQYTECVATSYSSFVIQTNLPFVNGSQMPRIRVWGTAYFEGTLDLSVVWHIFGGAFNTSTYTNEGSWRPSRVRLANVGGFVAIEIEDADGLYCPKFTVDALDYAPDANFDGWTITSGNLSGAAANIVTVAQAALGSVVSNAWLLDGNTTGAARNIGTKDNFDMPFITNNTERMRITNGGNVGIGTNAPSDKLQVANGNVRVGEVNPSGSGAFPNAGRELYFSGGLSSSAYNSDNSDPLFIRRYNQASDQSDLQFIIGDNVGSANNDRLTIGDNSAQRIALSASGHVGINTLLPATNLNVVGSTRLEQNAATLQLVGNAAGHSYIEYYPFSIASGRQAYVGFPSNGSTDFNIYNENAAGNINFSTPFNTTNPELSIRANGNVGIGTASPSTKLHLENGQFQQRTTTDVSHSLYMNNTASNRGWQLYHLGSTDANAPNGFMFEYFNGTAWARRMTINQNGSVGINSNSFSSILNVQGNVELQNVGDNMLLSRNDGPARHIQLIGTYMGWDQRGIYLGGYNQNNLSGSFSDANRVYCGGSFGSMPITATAFTVASSQRYKQNIIPTMYGLSSIMQLRPVQYQYNFDKLEQTHVGLIAEEVNKVIPEIVVKQDEKGEETKDLNGKTMGVNYSELVPVLIKAMQEQQQQIEAQQQQIQQLQQKIEDLNKK